MPSIAVTPTNIKDPLGGVWFLSVNNSGVIDWESVSAAASPTIYLVDVATGQTYQLGAQATYGNPTLTPVPPNSAQTKQILVSSPTDNLYFIFAVNGFLESQPLTEANQQAGGASSGVSLISGQLIPLDNSPNQTWNVTLSINSTLVTIGVLLSYNEVAQLWEMSIFDANGNLLLDSLPLVTGLNLLQQFQYLNLGSAYIVNIGGVDPPDYPNNMNLGSSFVLVWGSNAA